ncbi:(2R)-3-sulfolactate dehydrogenase (NADP+) [Rhizobium sp. RU20A]|uniref:Ldh family oxidoreductase n=1 Tax=Rhizobium sp. RU20A TaxID=1907412 RepID=UPI000955DEC9|nr:Ldh family oxidoreductase [Rhizobium sp. RU20A]SIQ28181.1 (2R)-3-sulfolactate dehydrogenase (NADP+) [Rhizobium sp. RU20A]
METPTTARSDRPVKLPLAEAFELAEAALLAAGAGRDMARALAAATVDAEAHGQPSVGFAHLLDYLESLKAGRINGKAEPIRDDPAPAIIRIDAAGGIAQHGFALAFNDLVARAGSFGIALFSLSGSYTTGELGYYTRRIAQAGLVAFAATNGPAIMSVPGATGPVYCTNPLSFAAPAADSDVIFFDQSSSATAFVNIRAAAEKGERLAEGIAVDVSGQPTTDPAAALRGALLTFGAERGANIALMVEILAAGLTGANWSLDAGSFTEGKASPGAGLLIVAIAPAVLDRDFPARLAAQAKRLERIHGVHIPGRRKLAARRRAERDGITLPKTLHDRITAWLTKDARDTHGWTYSVDR